MAGPDIELRVYLPIPELRRQFAAYMGTPTRARGYPPMEGEHSLILKAVPEVEPGILFVERQFGVLELHAKDAETVERAGAAILAGINAEPSHQLKPRILYSDIIENITDQHAVIVNRNRQASMVLPGETLLVYEMTPALFAAMAANEAERVAPDVTVVDIAMIGATGRIYMSGKTESVIRARDEITRVLEAVVGRDHG